MIIDHAGLLPLSSSEARSELDQFRVGLHSCLTRRADALFEIVDAVACSPGRVTDLARLTLDAEYRRGHGALYDALNCGAIDTEQLRALLTAAPVPKIVGPDGRERIVLAVDVSNWLRPDASTSPERSFCHTYARGRGQAQMIPGWPYSFVAALESGASSWTALLDVARLRAGDDATLATAAQLRGVVGGLIRSGHHRHDDPDIVVVCDAGYDVTRLAWLLADLPAVLIGRVRSDRVFYTPAGKRKGPTKGRPPRHGERLSLREAATQTKPTATTVSDTDRYGRCAATAFARMHPKIDSRGGWIDHDGPLPLIKGTLVRLHVERLPGDRSPKPLWLWSSKPVPDNMAEIDHWWSMFIRRFDLEHTFRFLKQNLGWVTPRLREPDAADRWTWLVIAAHTGLRLARSLATDCRLPWQRPLAQAKLTPGRVRASYRRICRTLFNPANAPKPSRPGPGRTKGRKNTRKAPHQPVGKHGSSG